MTLLEGLQSHRGGLLRIKSELYWYGGRGFDGYPGRVCLILDGAASTAPLPAPPPAPPRPSARTRRADPNDRRAALLLIDGCPHWVWLNSTVVELL